MFGQGLNAIMGPTGAGKTTFLDLLAGRKKTKELTGGLYLDAEPIVQNFNMVSGLETQITASLMVHLLILIPIDP